jgi:hypothetical protein
LSLLTGAALRMTAFEGNFAVSTAPHPIAFERRLM